MESGIQSSFIPQDASKPTSAPRGSRGSGGLGELGLLISIVLLVASGALAGAVFLYGEYANASASSKVQQLQRAKDAFEPSLITQLTRLDDRMRAADEILATHIGPIALFDALQQSTLTTVSFQSLSFNAFDAQHMTLKMQGTAQSVNSIALQADLFSKNGVVTNPIFSDITRQVDGVHFTLNAAINPAAINYVRVLSGSSQAAAAAPAPVITSPFGGTAPQTPASTTQAVPSPAQPAKTSGAPKTI